MILYILAGIILCIILFFIYIRIKYRFWALQPVFHFYDIYYWFINVGIIRHELPEKNRYTNFKNITTKTFEQLSETVIKQIVILIQLNYLRNNENTFTPQKNNIVPYFIGHSAPTFWSYYTEPELLIDNKHSTTIQEDKIIKNVSKRVIIDK